MFFFRTLILIRTIFLKYLLFALFPICCFQDIERKKEKKKKKKAKTSDDLSDDSDMPTPKKRLRSTSLRVEVSVLLRTFLFFYKLVFLSRLIVIQMTTSRRLSCSARHPLVLHLVLSVPPTSVRETINYRRYPFSHNFPVLFFLFRTFFPLHPYCS